MPETRARFTLLDETASTHLRAKHDPWGGVTFQHFTLGQSMQVALTADQLATFLRTLPLDVVRDACMELEARAIAHRTVLAEVDRLAQEDNTFFGLDDAPAPQRNNSATCPRGLSWDACEGADCQEGVCYRVPRPAPGTCACPFPGTLDAITCHDIDISASHTGHPSAPCRCSCHAPGLADEADEEMAEMAQEMERLRGTSRQGEV